MRLGLVVGYSGARVQLPMDLVLHAEKLGYDSVWTSEAYGSDAVTPAAWILARTERIRVGTAIMQMPARSPAAAAMTAMTLDQLSGGRFILGLGPSGPQVSEGWHGVAYGKPLTRTREYVEIIRRILAREEPVVFEGSHYQLPYRGEGATGLGKALKSIVHGNPDIAIYTAAISPGGLACAAEVADGVLPLWLNPERFDALASSLEKGFARAKVSEKRSSFEVAPFVTAILGDDLEACRALVKANLALYIGGMGSRERNFYKDYAARLGYPKEAERIQALYLEGKKKEAAASVPNALVDDLALVGSEGRIRDRLAAWVEAGKRGEVSSMLIAGGGTRLLELIAEEVL